MYIPVRVRLYSEDFIPLPFVNRVLCHRFLLIDIIVTNRGDTQSLRYIYVDFNARGTQRYILTYPQYLLKSARLVSEKTLTCDIFQLNEIIRKLNTKYNLLHHNCIHHSNKLYSSL